MLNFRVVFFNYTLTFVGLERSPMTPQTLFIIIVSIVVFNFLFSRIMEYLNARRYGDPVPGGLEDVYDADD